MASAGRTPALGAGVRASKPRTFEESVRALSTDIDLAVSMARARPMALASFAAIRERSKFGVAIANSTVNATAEAPSARTQCFQTQRPMGRNPFEPTATERRGVFCEAAVTRSSNWVGTAAILQLDSECEVLRNSAATSLHSVHWSMWAETDCARSAESSPSTNAITSSGAKGCVVVLMRVPLSELCSEQRPSSRERMAVPAKYEARYGRGRDVRARCSAEDARGRRFRRSSVARIREGGEFRGPWVRVFRRRGGPTGRTRWRPAWRGLERSFFGRRTWREKRPCDVGRGES